MQYVVKFEGTQPGSFDPDKRETICKGSASFYDRSHAETFKQFLLSSGGVYDADLYVVVHNGRKTTLVEYEALKRIALSMLDHETAPTATVARADGTTKTYTRKPTVDERVAQFRGELNGASKASDYDDKPGEYEDHADA